MGLTRDGNPWTLGAGRILVVAIPARHGGQETVLINCYQRTQGNRAEVLDHIRRICVHAIQVRQANVILGADFNASLIDTRKGYTEDSRTRTHDAQLRQFYNTPILGRRWVSGNAPQDQHSYHTHDSSNSALLDGVWILCYVVPKDSQFQFELNIRQPCSQVFDHWIVQADLPQNILPPHDSSDRGHVAGLTVDLDHWRSNISPWREEVIRSFKSCPSTDPLARLLSLSETLQKHLQHRTLHERRSYSRPPYEKKTIRRLSRLKSFAFNPFDLRWVKLFVTGNRFLSCSLRLEVHVHLSFRNAYPNYRHLIRP